MWRVREKLKDRLRSGQIKRFESALSRAKARQSRTSASQHNHTQVRVLGKSIFHRSHKAAARLVPHYTRRQLVLNHLMDGSALQRALRRVRLRCCYCHMKAIVDRGLLIEGQIWQRKGNDGRVSEGESKTHHKAMTVQTFPKVVLPVQSSPIRG